MATREENLKKINYELEKLSDEELDMVTGGSLGEILAKGIQDAVTGLCGGLAELFREFLTNPKYAPQLEKMINEHPELAEKIHKMQDALKSKEK
ncbi:MAG: hypothetical protein IKZ53_03010 [Selenomonadaceae bacterium]|nr:hypothetical protein [Selenomonadaceae bacterium]